MVTIPLYSIYDFALHSGTEHNNLFRVPLTATFEHASGARIECVPGFYNGDDEFVIRFSPTLEGQWRGKTESEDPVLSRIWLEPITVTPKVAPQAHGVVGLDPSHPQRFAWEDGTPFLYLGFECDWLFAYHQKDPAQCERHVELVANRGFNTFVMNIYAHTGFSDAASSFEGDVIPDTIYAPPDMYVFGGTNDTPDHAHLNVDFFKDYDLMMQQLHKRGVVAHLMLQVQNKHVSWPARGSAADDTYWRYVVARYQAFGNVIWDIGKESYNLLNETGSHGYTIGRMALIRETDAYNHLVTVHDPVAGSAGRVSAADTAADFVSDQIHLADVGRYNREALRRQQLLAKPYLNIEYGYELGIDDLKTYKSRTTAPWLDVLKWTYALYLAGAYPCYYYSNTSWDLIKFEPEPPGWARYQILMALLEQLPFNKMQPANVLVGRGYCLADPGKAYVVYLPDGGDADIDLTAIRCPIGPRGQLLESEHPITAGWMDITTGERRDVEISGWSWGTRVANPFEDKEKPVVLTILIE